MKLAYEAIFPSIERQGNLPPIVFLHGLGDSRATWQAVLPQIVEATGRTAYSADLRDHGDSCWTNEFDFDVVTEDLIQFLDSLNLFRIVLLAHSGSGKSAMDFAFRQPQRVEKLIIEDMTPKPLVANKENFTVKFFTTLNQYVQSVPITINEVTAKYVGLQNIKYFDSEDRIETEQLQKNAHVGFIAIKKGKEYYELKANMDAILKFMVSKKLEKELSGVYEGDALFLYGSKSFYKIGTDDLIPKLFPRAIKQEIKKSSHFCHLENPEEFVKYVTNFITENPAVFSKY